MRSCFGTLPAVLLLVGVNVAGQPVISQLSVPSSARVMDREQLTASVNGGDDPRGLDYTWRIVSQPTALAARITQPTFRRTTLELRWQSEQTANSAVGQVLTVELEVNYVGADPQVEPPTIKTAGISITGVNHAPVPVISGNLGTPSNRIESGQAVTFSSLSSSDPDGDSIRAEWGLGTTSGGSWIPTGSAGPPIFGSNTASASFTVPNMTAPIDQEIILLVENGLHSVQTRATAYLAPASTAPPTGNRAPALSIPQSTVLVAQGQTAQLQASATDSNNDDLSFTWIFLLDSSTVSPSQVSTQKVGSRWTSTVQFPTGGLSVGTYQFSVQAFETNSVDRWGSVKGFITLIVNTSGGGGTGGSGFFREDRNICGTNNGPALVSIFPDPRNSAITLAGGQQANVELLFQDNSSKQSPLGGVQQGVRAITWDLSALSQRGIQATGTRAQAVTDPTQAKANLSFAVPSGISGEARVTATAEDVLDCTTTIEFGLVFASSSNAPPVANIRYDHDDDTILSGPFPSGHSVQTGNRNILLDGSASSDDGGSFTLNWSVAGLGATLSTPSGNQTTLTIPEGVTGSVTVTLTVTDSGGLSSASSVTFNIAAQGASPSARITYDEQGEGSFNGPFSSGHIVNTVRRNIILEAGDSTDDGGIENLNFSWSVAGILGAALSSSTGQRTTLVVPSSALGTVTVTLTVTDAQSLTDSTTISFSYSTAGEPPSALIVSYPESAAAGEEIEIEGLGESGGGSGTFVFQWSARCCQGKELQVFSSDELARLVAPSLPEGETEGLVSIELTVSEDGVPSEPVSADIVVKRPQLHFAQVAVGQIDQTRSFQTAVVLVNSSSETLEGELVFINNDRGEDWELIVDGERASRHSFTIKAEGAREFLLTGQSPEFGWMSITANTQLAGHLFYRVVEEDLFRAGEVQTLSEVPILPVTGQDFRTAMPMETKEDENIGIAIVNTSDEELTFRLVFLPRGDFTAELATETFSLGGREHLAKFLSEIIFDELGTEELPDKYRGGTLIIEGQASSFVTTILKTRDGFPMSILPVASDR